ncbi:hypothetical protein WS98_21385 [Burkholderia territorii]|nr:hypothetical protein WS98_21385 [Burkholderia territorii]
MRHHSRLELTSKVGRQSASLLELVHFLQYIQNGRILVVEHAGLTAVAIVNGILEKFLLTPASGGITALR